MKLLIVRHGETEFNFDKKLTGHLSTPLTSNGRNQAIMLSNRLLDYQFDYILSSDLLRARQTTEEILKLLDAPVKDDTRLKERTWGIFDGQPVIDYFNDFEQSGLEFHKYRSTHGESLLDVQKRITPLLKELKSGKYGESVLLSGHECVNKVILFTLLNIPWEEWRSYEQGNTALNLLEIQPDGKAAVEFLNSTEHLSA